MGPRRRPQLPRSWRLYEVEVQYGSEESHTEVVAAPSRGAARYARYVDVSDAIPGLTFAYFQRHSSVRLIRGSPRLDSYRYIREVHGLVFSHGDRVRLTDEGGEAEGVEGTVVHPRGGTRYVSVVLDGDNHVGLHHPGCLARIREERA